ncbi:MAG: RHS repeat-associated core domain-containing protein [Acidobacteriaceae bacterium]
MTWTSVNSAVNGFQYDGAGNVLNDNANAYLYDAEGRLCAVEDLTTGAMTGYLYDAEGNRVGKGTIASFSCDAATNGFHITSSYVLGLGGEQFAELDGGGNWVHTNVFAEGKLLATYAGADTYFALTDWLGSKRAEVTPDGQLSNYFSLPWGNGLASSGNAPDATEHHFTGQIHDQESGNEFFNARYYASGTGRMISPDPAGMQAVDLEYPQSLNRYAYVQNNPLSFTDPFGLDCAYLNNAGTGIENGGIDQSGTSSECGQTGGYWVNGTLTDAQINADAGTVQLTGTTNGEDTTSASYQDTSVNVGWFQNPGLAEFNRAGHVALGLQGQTPVGLNPTSDLNFLMYAVYGGKSGGVPGVVKPQVGGQLKGLARIPVTGMQAQMIQNEVHKSMQPGNAPNYDVLGGGGPACDCAGFAQRILGDAGINAGKPTDWPSTLIQQLNSLYPQVH